MSNDVSEHIATAKTFLDRAHKHGADPSVIIACLASTIEALECMVDSVRGAALDEAARECWSASDELAGRDDMTTEQGMAQVLATRVRSLKAAAPAAQALPTAAVGDTWEIALAAERKAFLAEREAFLAEREVSEGLRNELALANATAQRHLDLAKNLAQKRDTASQEAIEQRRRAESAEQTIVELYDKEKHARMREDAAVEDLTVLMPLAIAATDILQASTIPFEPGRGACIGYWFADRTLPDTEIRFNPRVRLDETELRAAADVHKRRK